MNARVVLLGASNVTRGISTIVETARQILGAPIEIQAALGHGRSYGARSCVLVRSLPGITECGLWNALDRGLALPTFALISDIGNDVLYGAPVASIVAWVRWCVERLARQQASIVITQLPIANLEGLSNRRFLFFRSLFVPGCRLSLAEVKRRAVELNQAIVQLAAEFDLNCVGQRADWYGFDPMHLNLWHWQRAWGEILNHWTDGQAPTMAVRGSLPRWLRLRACRPQHFRLFGVELHCRQPALTMSDGTTVSLY